MPLISSFYGIYIRMYFIGEEHNPPHIHAIYNDNTASIDIKKCAIIEGELPNKAKAMVLEWVKLHQKELLKIWEEQVFKEIEPLE